MTYANTVVKAVVADAVAPAQVVTEQQMQGFADEWVVVAQLSGGGTRADPRFRGGRNLIQVDGYAAGSKRAYALCQQSLDAIITAWRANTATPDGHIAGVSDVVDPAPLPSGAKDLYRYTSTLRVFIR